MLKFTLLATLAITVIATPVNPTTLAPLYTPPAVPGSDSLDSHLIKDSYLIVLEDHLEDHEIVAHHAKVNWMHKAHQRQMRSSIESFVEHAGLRHSFKIGGKKGKKTLKGYSGEYSDKTIQAVRAIQGVKYVERDSIVKTTEITAEKGAPWGLARISHRKPLSFGTFNRYDYERSAGMGVDVYVIDT